MFCSNCGKEVENNARFCSNCGQPIKGGTFCSSCGAPKSSEAQVCNRCGATLVRTQQVSQSQYVPPASHNATPPPQYIPPAAQQPMRPSDSRPMSKHSASENVNSHKSKVVAAILALLFGQLGVHRFYVGKNRTATTQLILAIIGYLVIIFSLFGYVFLAAVGIWVLVDFIMILSGSFKDNKGLLIN